MPVRYRKSLAAAARRISCLFVGGLAALSISASASAQDLDDGAALLYYKTPQKPRYLRVAVEEFALLGLGLAQYWYDKESNSRDWQFSYDWPSFRARLEGKAYAFDSNGFDTNFLFHPIAGTLYYLTPRSNRFDPFASFAIALGTSWLWEFFGEFQEKPSINDLVVTPVAGMAWGETTTQLGAFFLRACPTAANQMLGSVLAPMTALHDAIDGAERLPSCNPDAPEAHRFRLSATGGEAWSEGLNAYPFVKFGLRTEVMHLTRFARPGVGWSTFSDGNVSRLGVGVTLATAPSEVADFSLLTQTVIAGLHYRNNDYHKGYLRRREAIFGLLVGAEYTRHRYQPGQPPDRIFLLDLPAFTARYYGSSANIGWELTLDAGGVFGGADSFALSRAMFEAPPAPDLTSVATAEGYNHVAGIALNPRFRLELQGAELGLEARSERMLAWRVSDHTGKSASTPVSEQRRRTRWWISVGTPHLVRFTVATSWTQRSGEVGEVRVSRNELSLDAGLELAP